MLEIRYERRRDYITQSALGLDVPCKADRKTDAASVMNSGITLTGRPLLDKMSSVLSFLASLPTPISLAFRGLPMKLK